MHIVNADLLCAYVEGAQNSSDLSNGTIKSIKSAHRIGFTSVEINGSRSTISIRRYELTHIYDGTETTKTNIEVNLYTGKKVPIRRTARQKLEEKSFLWEVREQTESTFSTWIYDMPIVALNSYSYLLQDGMGSSSKRYKSRYTEIRDLLSDVLKNVIGLNGSIDPFNPKEDAVNSPAIVKASLEALAMEARDSGASTDRLKKLALDIYLSGETNIRRIGILTGLARDTVYRALKSERIDRVRNIDSAT